MGEERMDFEPASTLTERIADHLGGEIITGKLKPSARIQELKVAGELGVSRGSVREALLLLEARHLIEIIPRRGAVVSTMESNEIANFCEVFSEMQMLCFAKLAELPAPDLSGLDEALAEMTTAVTAGDIRRLLQARKQFLFGSLPPLDNFYLSSVLKGLVPAGLRMEYLATLHPTYDARDTLRYHQALTDAVRNHETGRVRELVRAYHGRERKLAGGRQEDNGRAG